MPRTRPAASTSRLTGPSLLALLLAVTLGLVGCQPPPVGPRRPSAKYTPANPVPTPSHPQAADPSLPALSSTVGATPPAIDPSLQTPRGCGGAVVVGPEGVDDLSMNPNGPWRTVKFAAQHLTEGATACVRPGSYDGRIDTANPGAAGKAIWLTGFPNQPRPVLTNFEPPAGLNAPLVKIDRPYWRFGGFEIAGTVDHDNDPATAAKSVHGVAVQVADTTQTVIENLKTAGGNSRAAVAFDRTREAVLRESEISDWQHWLDGNGQEQEAHGVIVTTNSAGILVQDNDSESHSGDSLQCVHAAVGQPPTNLTVTGNRYRNDEENAVDVKTCTQVTIGGNTLWGYRPVDQGSNQSRFGDALVVHEDADQILIERNDIRDSGRALSVGASGGPGSGMTGVGLVVVRRNEIHDMHHDPSLPAPLQAAGAGLRMSPLRQVEIYHNTFSSVPGYAIRLGDDGKIQRAVLLNNLVAGVGTSIELVSGNVADLASDHNLFTSDRFLVDGQNLLLQNWTSLQPGRDTNSFLAAPHFVLNPLQSGYHTLPWSPARDVAGRIGNQLGGQFCFDGPDLGARETCFRFDDSAPSIAFEVVDQGAGPVDTNTPIPGRPTINLLAQGEDLEVGIKSVTISGDVKRYCVTADGMFSQSAIIQSWNQASPPVARGDDPPVDRLVLLSINLGSLPHTCPAPLKFSALEGRFTATAENFDKLTANSSLTFTNT
jgi:parallel beta helix pectate lyase-like protein